MAKTLSVKNAKDWRTTVMGIVAGIILLAGIFWPDKINAETGQVITTALNEILIGVSAIVGIIVSILGKD